MCWYTSFVYCLVVIHDVELSRLALRQLRKVPRHVVDKLLAWIHLVEEEGLEEARKIPGFHDEPLLGRRVGQRSVRLSRAYRAIYKIEQRRVISFVVVEKVTKHDY